MKAHKTYLTCLVGESDIQGGSSEGRITISRKGVFKHRGNLVIIERDSIKIAKSSLFQPPRLIHEKPLGALQLLTISPMGNNGAYLTADFAGGEREHLFSCGDSSVIYLIAIKIAELLKVSVAERKLIIP